MNSVSYSATGTKSTTAAKLSKDIFGLEVANHDLIKQAYVAYHSNSRENAAFTMTRGMIRGGGKKPWRQKGTGRARFGSTRNPIWRGGGIVFGPTGNENFTKKLNLKSKRLAIRQALSLSAEVKDKLIIIEDIKIKSAKSADVVKLLKKIEATKRVLIVIDNLEDNFKLSIRNLQNVKAIRPRTLNVFDILNADHIVITKPALAEIEKWLGA
jgi:large subunit ribosomal protein L4